MEYSTLSSYEEVSLRFDENGALLCSLERHKCAEMLMRDYLKIGRMGSEGWGDVYFDPSRFGILPQEMRERMREKEWYTVTFVHTSPANVSYDIRTPEGLIERVGSSWFEKIRHLPYP